MDDFKVISVTSSKGIRDESPEAVKKDLEKNFPDLGPSDEEDLDEKK